MWKKAVAVAVVFLIASPYTGQAAFDSYSRKARNEKKKSGQAAAKASSVTVSAVDTGTGQALQIPAEVKPLTVREAREMEQKVVAQATPDVKSEEVYEGTVRIKYSGESGKNT